MRLSCSESGISHKHSLGSSWAKYGPRNENIEIRKSREHSTGAQAELREGRDQQSQLGPWTANLSSGLCLNPGNQVYCAS